MLVFDTSVIIAIEKNNKETAKEISKLSKIYTGQPQITFVTYHEFLFGVKNRSPKNQSKALDFLNNFNCLSASKETAQIMTDLRQKYNKKGVEINLADLIIASQVKENKMTLVSRDKIFEKIDEIDKIII